MDVEKAKLETLSKKMDDLIMILGGITEDLRQLSTQVKCLVAEQVVSSSVSERAKPPRPIVSPPIPELPRPAQKSKPLEDAKAMFPDELERMLDFEEKDTYVLVKPKQFLGTENFSKIASIIRQEGGEYISAGKASHFRIPKSKD